MQITKPRCPVSGSTEAYSFFRVDDMPAHVGIQWSTRDAAVTCPKGDIDLHFAPESGHIFNPLFDPALMEYTEAYDNSLHYSPRFQAYTEAVVDRLIRRYDLRDKKIVEIGCGKGDFLMMLVEAGSNTGVGFDPSYEERPIDPAIADRISFVQDFFTEEHAREAADLICSRYVFEHIPEPVPFLQTVRRAIGDRLDTVVYFEVPNVDLILDDLSVWDIIYEHCAYFSTTSLADVFARCGFEVRDVVEGYDGQFIGIEAVPLPTGQTGDASVWKDVETLEAQVRAYQDNFERTIATWRERLSEMHATGQTGVLWGAGAKAVGFLNMLQISDEQVGAVVDINPNKQGKFMAGTGQRIIAPEDLPTHAPDVVIIMNPIYRHEIQQTVQSLGLDVEYLLAS